MSSARGDALPTRERGAVHLTELGLGGAPLGNLYRAISDETWAVLASRLKDTQMIELCMLAGHYEMLAMTLNSLRVEPDKVRVLNRYMEQKAWGAFRYQVFPAYDFAPIAANLKTEHA